MVSAHLRQKIFRRGRGGRCVGAALRPPWPSPSERRPARCCSPARAAPGRASPPPPAQKAHTCTPAPTSTALFHGMYSNRAASLRLRLPHSTGSWQSRYGSFQRVVHPIVLLSRVCPLPMAPAQEICMHKWISKQVPCLLAGNTGPNQLRLKVRVWNERVCCYNKCT